MYLQKKILTFWHGCCRHGNTNDQYEAFYEDWYSKSRIHILVVLIIVNNINDYKKITLNFLYHKIRCCLHGDPKFYVYKVTNY